MPHDSPFDFTIGNLKEAALRVASFRGRERLSHPYAFDVVVTSWHADEPDLLESAMGQPARLQIHGARAVRGVIRRCESAALDAQGRATYKIRLVPRLASLKHRRNTRIFQDQTTPEVVSAVLDEAGVPHRWDTQQAYAARSYCVQYEETDLEFVQRLLAEVGIFYSFEHAGAETDPIAPEVMILGDRPQYPPIDGEPRLVHRRAQPGVALALEEHHVTAFHLSRRAAPAAYTRRDYDFERPFSALEAAASVPALPGEGEEYEHHGEFAEAESVQRLETSALEQLRRKTRRASGESACPRLLAGRRFSLDEHEQPGHDGDYVVIAMEHEGRAAELAGDGPTYGNRFDCIPAGSVFRPARRARQLRQVMETAVVTGPAGQEIHTDAHGRVKVQFHWDRKGKRDERSSCWLRVAQGWSGTGWGFQFIPRIGMEVLVSFLGGDPDRPMVVGCVPNATHPVPYPLPENQTKSGIKTESTPGGGGYNEILFEDAKGSELVAIRAERNLSEVALNDHLQSIGRDQTVSIAGARKAEIKGDDTLRVEGGQICTVSGPSTVSVGGRGQASYAGDRAASIAGDDTLRVGGGQRVIAAYQQVLLGQGMPEGHGAVFVNGEYRIAAAGSVKIGGEAGLTLSCGDSSIELLPGEIKIKALKVTVTAADELLVKGKDHEIAATDHLELRGQDVRLFGKEGQLLLDENARLNGKQVKLGAERAKPEEEKSDESVEKGNITFKVKPHFPVQPGDRLVAVIATPTGKTVEADVDSSMQVTLEGKKGDTFVLVDLRKGDLPFGKRG